MHEENVEIQGSCTSDGVYRRNGLERPDRLCEVDVGIASHRARKET